MKTCTCCKESKQESEYYKDERNKSGLQARCKPCMKQATALWKSKNTGRIQQYTEEYRAKTKEHRALVKKAYYEKNKEKALAYVRNRELLKRNQKIIIDDFDTFVLEEAYHLSALRYDITGLKWHVDHIVPLQGKQVCGLHKAINFQVIPAELNRKKYNKFEDADMERLGLSVVK